MKGEQTVVSTRTVCVRIFVCLCSTVPSGAVFLFFQESHEIWKPGGSLLCCELVYRWIPLVNQYVSPQTFLDIVQSLGLALILIVILFWTDSRKHFLIFTSVKPLSCSNLYQQKNDVCSSCSSGGHTWTHNFSNSQTLAVALLCWLCISAWFCSVGLYEYNRFSSTYLGAPLSPPSLQCAPVCLAVQDLFSVYCNPEGQQCVYLSVHML